MSTTRYDKDLKRTDEVGKATPSISEVEGFWDERPCNVRHSDAEPGTAEYFEAVSKKKYFVEPHIREFAKFDGWHGKRVLDVGCGIGTIGASFASAGADYLGVDLSQVSLDLATQRFNLFGLRESFEKANVEELSNVALGGDGFDLIWSFGVLHHTPSIERALEVLRRLAEPGRTVLKIMLYAKDSWKQLMIDAGLDQPEAQSGCPIANSYTRDEVNELLRDAGFRVTSIRQEHIFPYKIEEYKRHVFVKQPWFEEMPKDVFKAMEQSLGWHMLIDAVPIEAGPQGH